jgi:hypothetical protein
VYEGKRGIQPKQQSSDRQRLVQRFGAPLYASKTGPKSTSICHTGKGKQALFVFNPKNFTRICPWRATTVKCLEHLQLHFGEPHFFLLTFSMESYIFGSFFSQFSTQTLIKTTKQQQQP